MSKQPLTGREDEPGEARYYLPVYIGCAVALLALAAVLAFT